MQKLVLGIVAAVVVIGVLVALATNQSVAPQPSASPVISQSLTASPITNATGSPQTNASATIVFNDSGFSPAQTTLNSGQSITFTNRSSAQIQVNSDPHPVHTDNQELNVGILGAGQSKTVTFTKKGAFGIHDHLNPSMKASVTVQ